MTSTPRFDSLAAGGTNAVYDRIRLADGHALTLRVQRGAHTVQEIFVPCGLLTPDTAAWKNEGQWEAWLTGDELSDGTLYLDVPVAAVRDLIEQHGGEHEDQKETAETLATRALAARGITARTDNDEGNTWLAIGHDQTRQGFPRMIGVPYAVLYLYNDTVDEEITIVRAPRPGDRWFLLLGDGSGAERRVLASAHHQLAECVEAIAEWVADPVHTAGAALLSALAEKGLATDGGHVSTSYAIPPHPSPAALETYNYVFLPVSDECILFMEKGPYDRSGWTVFLHDGIGTPASDPILNIGTGGLVDGPAASETAASLIVEWLAARPL
ncbi:hypothetical protein ACFYWO_39820 [Streptomyces sp. NPDC002932]|uniref:hypothetical protein n=1 Tax=Streptomyces sp. NPDC002932 TaxID=3364672 RepID=UPI0036A1A15E